MWHVVFLLGIIDNARIVCLFGESLARSIKVGRVLAALNITMGRSSHLSLRP